MRIHVLGNILNWGMAFGGLLRAAGHEVRVFVNRREPAFYQPEWENPEWRPEEAPFVELVELEHWRSILPGARERDLLRRIGDCDLIQTFGEYALWAMWAGRPYVVLSYGCDLDALPFKFWGPKSLALALLLRRSYSRASAFVYALPGHRPWIERLGLENAVFDPHAVPIDTGRYAPLRTEERRALRRRWTQRWVFFHGVRQEWDGRDPRTTDCKANDRLFEGFSRFAREEPDSLLIAVRKGRDLAASQVLVARLGIERQVLWTDELTKPEIIRMLNSVDAFCDQFSFGYYGLATLEALSCGVPALIYLDRALPAGEFPPVINAGTAPEIHAALKALAQKPADREPFMEGRDWVLKHHSWGAVGRRFRDLYARCVTGSRSKFQ